MSTTRSRFLQILLTLGMLLGGVASCTFLPTVAPPEPTPSPTATPPPAPRIRVWVPPAWGPGTPGGLVLAEALDTWAVQKGVTLVFRVYTLEEMRSLLESASLIAPQALPHLLLVEQGLVEEWVREERLLALPQEDPWITLVQETSWFPYARSTVWVGGGFYALPWAGNAWTLWVPSDQVEAWDKQPWETWFRDDNTWAFPAALEEPWPLWSLYRVAGGAFPPSSERTFDRQALLQVFTLLADSRTHDALPRQVLQWRTVDDVMAFAQTEMWLLPYAQGGRDRARVPVWIPTPQGEPGPTLGWVYAWVVPQGIPESVRPLVLDALRELQQPRTRSRVVDEGKWLPVARMDPWPETFPWPPEDLDRLDARPGPSVMGSWHALLATQARDILDGLVTPEEAVQALLGE